MADPSDAGVTGDESRVAALAAAEKIRELSGDVADTLSGFKPPGCELTYRGSLLHDLLEASLVLRKAYLAEHPPDPVCVCGHPKSGHVAATPTQLVCVAVGMDCPCLDYEPEPGEPPC